MEVSMFNPTQIVIKAFVEELQEMYGQVYGVLEPAYPGIIGFIARLALENIANSDAPYHDVNHTSWFPWSAKRSCAESTPAKAALLRGTGCISSSPCCVTTSGMCGVHAAAIGTDITSAICKAIWCPFQRGQPTPP